MKINILTIFPEFFSSPFAVSIIKRAIASEVVEINVVNIRDYAQDKHKLTDDRPFGGGAGMVMKIEPIDIALQSLGVSKGKENSQIILTSAKGQLFNQQIAKKYSKLKELTIICGHYEGVDERVADNLVDEEVRIGDYVLTGGEIASVVITDAVVRLLDGVLGNAESTKGESHEREGQLAYPQYTRPEEYKGLKVPEILLTGDHKKIEQWREENRRLKFIENVKSEKLKAGIDYTGVSVIFFCHDGNGNYLLNKRSKNCRDEHRAYDPGGGGIEFDDDVIETLKREIKEEYCTDVLSYEFLGYRDVHRTNNGKKTHWLALDFKVLVDRKKVKNGEPHKFEELVWAKIDNLPTPLHSQFPYALEKYRSKFI